MNRVVADDRKRLRRNFFLEDITSNRIRDPAGLHFNVRRLAAHLPRFPSGVACQPFLMRCQCTSGMNAGW